MSLRRPKNGFSLIELLIVVSIIGITLAVSIPAYQRYLESNALRFAARDIASAVQQSRARAMSTHLSQTIHFAADSAGAGDYHLHNGTVVARWTLPRNITYASGSSTGFTLGVDGRASTSSYVILQDQAGRRDTVSVQLSGLVLVR